MRHCRQLRNGIPKVCTKKQGLEKLKVRLSVVLRTAKLTNQKNLLEYLHHTRPQKLQKFISRPMKRRFSTQFALLPIIWFPRDTFRLSYFLITPGPEWHYIYTFTGNLLVIDCYIFQLSRFLCRDRSIILAHLSSLKYLVTDFFLLQIISSVSRVHAFEYRKIKRSSWHDFE